MVRVPGAGEAVTLAALAAITFATSADHVLTVGARNGVSGWQAWSVAGTVEIVAAYAGLEFARREGKGRVLPGIVFAGAASFLVAANWKAAEGLSRWGHLYHVMPPVTFLSVMLIAETKRWQRHPAASPEASADGTAGGSPGNPADGSTGGSPGGGAGGSTQTTADRILAALTEGPLTPAQMVAKECGSAATVKTQVARLKDAKQIQPVIGKRGVYRLAKKLTAVS